MMKHGKLSQQRLLVLLWNLSWLWGMMQYRHSKILPLFAAVILALFSNLMSAADFQKKLTNADCRVIEATTSDSSSIAKFSDALLWKVSKAGNSSSYIYADGTTLKDYLDDDLFYRTAKVLSAFQLPVEAVVVMRPWAAFLIMNYPADNTLPLDLKLFEIAMDQGAKTAGLETLREQGAVFSEMALKDQLRLLRDTVCNYTMVTQGIEEMKQFYLARDLNGLLAASAQHPYADEPLYKELNKRLLTDRNKLMIDRMQPYLQKGNAFIAVGALHLPGNDGIIENLNQQGYKITAIY